MLFNEIIECFDITLPLTKSLSNLECPDIFLHVISQDNAIKSNLRMFLETLLNDSWDPFLW